MKSLVSIIFAYVLVRNIMAFQMSKDDEISSKVIAAAMECAKVYPLTLNDIISFKNQVFPDGKNSNCFAACFFRKFGMMDSAGMISPDEARKTAQVVFEGDEKRIRFADHVMYLCSAANKQSFGNEQCDRSKYLFECLAENAPKDYDFYPDYKILDSA